MKTLFIAFILVLTYTIEIVSQVNPDNYNELEESGDYKNALLLTKSKLEKDTLNADLWAETAKLYRLNQQYKQSIAGYEKALKIEPLNRKYLVSLAKVNKLAGIKDGSIILYREFLQYQPKNIMALSDLAEIYGINNMPDSAANTYQKLYSIDTSNVDYLCKWAYNQWNSGKLYEAFGNYKKAYLLDSNYLPAIYDLARIYVKYKMPDSAILILKKNIKVYPQESRLYADIGNANFSKSDFINAIPNYEKAINLGFKGIDAYKRLAISYYSLHEYEKSRQSFESLIQKDTNDYKVCMYLGHIYNSLEQPEKGLGFLQKALDLIKPDPMVMATIYSGIENSYKGLGNYIEQISTIQKRQECLPKEYKSAKYLFEIAEIFESKIKDRQKALKYYQDYYSEIKNLSWLSQETKNTVIDMINKLKKGL
jgi:tetratricopeptide (TPR) repeat protein